MSKDTIVAIDGPSASGKSTVAKQLAQKLGATYVNSGIMYRAITHKCLKLSVPVSDEKKAISLFEEMTFTLSGLKLLVNGEDISDLLILPNVNKNVSAFSQINAIREMAISKQRNLAKGHAIVMDGRDIGTVVFPEATVKFFLTASLEVRAKRRYLELTTKQPELKHDLLMLEKELEERDRLDRERTISPLIEAADAIHIDNSMLSLEETVEKLYTIITHE
jgi:CMP/dCMP kinase